MGRVKTRKVKVLAREIMEKFPDRVSADFELNKMLVGEVLTGQISKKLRNQVAGYITRLVKRELEKAEEEAVAEAK
ncbi:MAG TPA: 30S ribosomal protein S17e [Nitrososphaeria archaeon]|nr:30S ribosomal protein S17e [Nitrososphaeria archaeon]